MQLRGGGLSALLASFMANFYSRDIVGIGGSVQRGLWGRTTELPVQRSGQSQGAEATVEGVKMGGSCPLLTPRWPYCPPSQRNCQFAIGDRANLLPPIQTPLKIPTAHCAEVHALHADYFQLPAVEGKAHSRSKMQHLEERFAKVRRYRHLYDVSNQYYKNQEVTANAWKETGKTLKPRQTQRTRNCETNS